MYKSFVQNRGRVVIPASRTFIVVSIAIFIAVLVGFSLQVKEKEQAMAAGRELEATRKELDHAKQWKGHFESTQAKMLELELEIKELREELNTAIIEKDETKQQAKTEKDELEEVTVNSFEHTVRKE